MTCNLRTGALLGALTGLMLPAQADDPPPWTLHHPVEAKKELLITATEVVDSTRATYPGPWSFGYLLEQTYGKKRAPKVVLDWLVHWVHGQKRHEKKSMFDGQSAERPSRPELVTKLVRPWQEADGYDPKSGKPWRPKLKNAPFRLLAIVNRIDRAAPLNGADIGKGPSSERGYFGISGHRIDRGGGEARLVFGVTDQEGNPLQPGTTVIFEYGLDVQEKHSHLQDWAEAWHGLGRHQQFDQHYLTELTKVTRAFTDLRSLAPPERPFSRRTEDEILAERNRKRARLPLAYRIAFGDGRTRSQLMRIRVNDGAFGAKREFREFKVRREGLESWDLFGTPRDSYFERDSFDNKWFATMTNNDGRNSDILLLRDQIETPLSGPIHIPYGPYHLAKNRRGAGDPRTIVQAKVASVPQDNPDYHWDGPQVDRKTRRAYSLQTCVGCHAGDTNTPFFHIAPRKKGEASKLSRFLQTDGSEFTIVDPAHPDWKIPSNEIETRRKALETILAMPGG